MIMYKFIVHLVISFSLLISNENMRLCTAYIWHKVRTIDGLL
jgi:hypothetical protein